MIMEQSSSATLTIIMMIALPDPTLQVLKPLCNGFVNEDAHFSLVIAEITVRGLLASALQATVHIIVSYDVAVCPGQMIRLSRKSWITSHGTVTPFISLNSAQTKRALKMCFDLGLGQFLTYFCAQPIP